MLFCFLIFQHIFFLNHHKKKRDEEEKFKNNRLAHIAVRNKIISQSAIGWMVSFVRIKSETRTIKKKKNYLFSRRQEKKRGGKKKRSKEN